LAGLEGIMGKLYYDKLLWVARFFCFWIG